VFGSNGTGKSTVGRVIANPSVFPACRITWRGGTPLQVLVYNHDFVDRNFHQAAELKGVFTLGEKNVDTITKINEAKDAVDGLTNTIQDLTQTLQGTDGTGGKKGELTTLESGFKAKCWAPKQKHDQKFSAAFEGYRNNQEKFKTKVLQEASSNAQPVKDLAELEKRASSVFGATPTNEARVAAVDAVKILEYEANPILKKRVFGKEDVDIAAMIKKLGNSDWVRQGRSFYDANGSICPFCQQRTTDAFAASLSEYFDDTFVADSKAIEDLSADYATEAARLQQHIGTSIAQASRFLDVEKLKVEKEILDTRILLNNQRLNAKKREPSQVVELESLQNVLRGIKSLVDSANAQVDNHNTMVTNLADERTTLAAQVWRFIVEELKTELVAYKTAKTGLEKAMLNITEKIDKFSKEKSAKTTEIREPERQTTSIQPSIDGINALLCLFGFQGFQLAKAASGTSYRLVRTDGSDARATLSEGEKNFVTFLYFYHLLKGSESASGMTTDRIVVFDDPVSSLDSDILFIVSNLIKGLIGDVRQGHGHIKQVFVLTHNVYFHKEVTFNPKRSGTAMREETFWVIRKLGQISKIEGHSDNPVKTCYELLWAEVQRQDRSNLTIQNTLRRILESYFKILGGIDPDEICAKFDGNDKLVCKSLLSWVNDGSHFASDDIFVSTGGATVERYLKVFRAVFEKQDHMAHYKMMMGNAYVEDAEGEAANGGSDDGDA
jgi:wobble nucleotide-excising tRNase